MCSSSRIRTFLGASAMSACSGCAAGLFQPSVGQTMCTDCDSCPAGARQACGGSAEGFCSDCIPGKYADASTSACVGCSSVSIKVQRTRQRALIVSIGSVPVTGWTAVLRVSGRGYLCFGRACGAARSAAGAAEPGRGSHSARMLNNHSLRSSHRAPWH
jgi:hypothetical protein